MTRLRIAATLATLVACDRGGQAPAEAASAPPTAPAPPRPAPYLHAPGPAYLGIDGTGLVRLEDGQLTTLVAHRYPVRSIVVDAEGAVYAAAIGGLWKVAGETIEHLDTEDTALLARLALGPDGVLWATDHRGVFRWDGGWTVEPPATFDGELVDDLAVDRAGHVWVTQREALWFLDGERWHRLDPAFAGTVEPFFSTIAAHPDGGVYVTSIRGTYRFRDGRWSDAGLSSRYGMLDELVIGPAGHVAGSGGVGTLTVQAPSGAIRTTELEDGPARARRGDVLAVDGAGRTWLATDNGLVIFDRDGALAQQWLPGTVAGVTGKITALAVVGDGPALPPLGPPVTGTITGRVLRGGRPVAGAAVELCDQPLTVLQRTPCESSTTTYRTTTGADGRFRLAAVAVGSYGFAIKPGPRWIVMLATDCCTALGPGTTYDVGALTVAP
ncbi:MAG: hypothetical protein R3B06_31035 [Kofleriaceae bacterium]